MDCCSRRAVVVDGQPEALHPDTSGSGKTRPLANPPHEQDAGCMPKTEHAQVPSYHTPIRYARTGCEALRPSGRKAKDPCHMDPRRVCGRPERKRPLTRNPNAAQSASQLWFACLSSSVCVSPVAGRNGPPDSDNGRLNHRGLKTSGKLPGEAKQVALHPCATSSALTGSWASELKDARQADDPAMQAPAKSCLFGPHHRVILAPESRGCSSLQSEPVSRPTTHHSFGKGSARLTIGHLVWRCVLGTGPTPTEALAR